MQTTKMMKKPLMQISPASKAAFKAWKTRRKQAKEAPKFVGKKNPKKNELKEKKQPSKEPRAELKGIEAKEMRGLNGKDLEQIVKDTTKKIERRDAIEAAHGRAKSVSLIIANAKQNKKQPKKLSKKEVGKTKKQRVR